MTTRRCQASGRTTKSRCRATRRASSKWWRGHPEGGKIPELQGNYGAFAPDYAPEEIFEIASKLYKKSR
jgi:hypothetical protein